MTDEDIDPDVLEELYIDEDMTREEVAEKLDAKIHHVNYLLRKHKIYKTTYGMVQAIARDNPPEDDEYPDV